MIEIIARIAAQGKHVVISSHDIDLIYEVCNAVYVMKGGRIVAQGEPGEVFSQAPMLQDAGLVQPWLVKLHSELG
ncbi:energy-coupling factor ABC transporter ATP-binding protein, partial [Escherichia coli]